jgi:uncharacterized membrane protein (UPF0127 family)
MIYNLTSKKCLSRQPVFAEAFFTRCRGMIGRDFQGFDAMVFNRCNAIHTLFMRIPLDVVFIDRQNRICAMRQSLPPWKLLVRAARAYAVIELPAGAIAQTGAMLGDVLDLNAELTREAGQHLTSKKLIDSMETVAVPVTRLPVFCPTE